ncbi:hypothetical protein BDF14DRAFT_1785892 [Spinellus fusiger]|nr:hypothetical protein BDF14DRAFT_1785892 [Spinellus fusiger]
MAIVQGLKGQEQQEQQEHQVIFSHSESRDVLYPSTVDAVAVVVAAMSMLEPMSTPMPMPMPKSVPVVKPISTLRPTSMPLLEPISILKHTPLSTPILMSMPAHHPHVLFSRNNHQHQPIPHSSHNRHSNHSSHSNHPLQKQQQHYFYRRVSFDTFTHQHNAKKTYTLSYCAKGYQPDHHARLFLLPIDLDSGTTHAVHYTMSVGTLNILNI